MFIYESYHQKLLIIRVLQNSSVDFLSHDSTLGTYMWCATTAGRPGPSPVVTFLLDLPRKLVQLTRGVRRAWTDTRHHQHCFGLYQCVSWLGHVHHVIRADQWWRYPKLLADNRDLCGRILRTSGSGNLRQFAVIRYLVQKHPIQPASGNYCRQTGIQGQAGAAKAPRLCRLRQHLAFCLQAGRVLVSMLIL